MRSNVIARSDSDEAIQIFRADGIPDCFACARNDGTERDPMTNFCDRQTVFCSLPVLLLLAGCSGGPVCDSSDARNSVMKIVSGDGNNALVNYAAKSSSAVEAKVNGASTDSQKSAILEKARQAASYRLDDTISTNSRSKDRRSVTCSGLLAVTVEDATAEKQVDFKVEQLRDGKLSVSVTPFQF